MKQNALPERTGLRPAQVLAAALAAITAAFLGSSLGVYGTVIGAGVVSLATTVGGEFYLRSLDRTKRAVKRTKAEAVDASAESAESRADGADGPAGEPRSGRLGRWPVLAGASVVAFALGMAAVTGIEALTGSSLSGEDGKTVTNMLRGGPAGSAPAQNPADVQEQVDDAPSSTPPPSSSSTPPPSTEPPVTSTEPAEPTESTPPEPPVETTEPEPSSEPTPTGSGVL